VTSAAGPVRVGKNSLKESEISRAPSSSRIRIPAAVNCLVIETMKNRVREVIG
jgi:hypothetical protein